MSSQIWQSLVSLRSFITTYKVQVKIYSIWPLEPSLEKNQLLRDLWLISQGWISDLDCRLAIRLAVMWRRNIIIKEAKMRLCFKLISCAPISMKVIMSTVWRSLVHWWTSAKTWSNQMKNLEKRSSLQTSEIWTQCRSMWPRKGGNASMRSSWTKGRRYHSSRCA